MDTMVRLDEILAQSNMSLYKLSKTSGIHYSTFEAAKKRNGQLSVDTIERICQTIGINTYEFFMTDDDWDSLDRYCRIRSDLRERRILSQVQA